MLKRLSVSFFRPSMIGAFASDKFWRVFLYMLLMIFLMIIPDTIMAITYRGFSETEFQAMKTDYINQASIVPSCQIENYKFYMYDDEDTVIRIQGIDVAFKGTPKTEIGLELQENGVGVCFYGNRVVHYSWKQLNLDKIDFTSLSYFKYDSSNTSELYSQFVKLRGAIDIITMDMKPLWAVSYIFINLVFIVIGYVMALLLFSFVVKLGTPLSYREVFTTIVYGFSMAVFGYVVCTFFNLPYLDIVFSLVSIVFIWRAIRVLILNKLIQSKILK